MNLEALLVPLTAALFYLVVCPYSKVEESFNLQAMHDVLYHGSNIAKYDHLEFPGVVPRTFIGPLAVSTLATPLVIAVDFLELNKFYTQLVVRGVLATLVLGALYFFQKAVSETLGHSVSLWFLAITTSQFHFLYYASRPLPNIMVLPLVLMACYFWIKQKHGWFIWLSACAIIWFRGELAILLGLILLGEMIGKRITIRKLLTHAIPAGVCALATTVVVDSIFWQQWLWPEGEVLWFNVVLNKSSEWGESPFLWYFYSALPRSLGTSIALIPLGAFWERRTRPLLFPALGFIFLYSFLPHKELRFIVYAIPLLNVAAAAACDRIWENRLKDNFRCVLALGAVLHICANLLFAGFLLTVSKHNYPGGEAMKLLHRLENPEVEASVYIDNLAAQTGVSRFMEVNQRWRYDKTENLKAEKLRLMSSIHMKDEYQNHLDSQDFSAGWSILHFHKGFMLRRFHALLTAPFGVFSKLSLFIHWNQYVFVQQLPFAIEKGIHGFFRIPAGGIFIFLANTGADFFVEIDAREVSFDNTVFQGME
nr:EOG090X04MD [Triops cancriformis]